MVSGGCVCGKGGYRSRSQRGDRQDVRLNETPDSTTYPCSMGGNPRGTQCALYFTFRLKEMKSRWKSTLRLAYRPVNYSQCPPTATRFFTFRLGGIKHVTMLLYSLPIVLIIYTETFPPQCALLLLSSSKKYSPSRCKCTACPIFESIIHSVCLSPGVLSIGIAVKIPVATSSTLYSLAFCDCHT